MTVNINRYCFAIGAFLVAGLLYVPGLTRASSATGTLYYGYKTWVGDGYQTEIHARDLETSEDVTVFILRGTGYSSFNLFDRGKGLVYGWDSARGEEHRVYIALADGVNGDMVVAEEFETGDRWVSGIVYDEVDKEIYISYYANIEPRTGRRKCYFAKLDITDAYPSLEVVKEFSAPHLIAKTVGSGSYYYINFAAEVGYDLFFFNGLTEKDEFVASLPRSSLKGFISNDNRLYIFAKYDKAVKREEVFCFPLVKGSRGVDVEEPKYVLPLGYRLAPGGYSGPLSSVIFHRFRPTGNSSELTWTVKSLNTENWEAGDLFEASFSEKTGPFIISWTE